MRRDGPLPVINPTQTISVFHPIFLLSHDNVLNVFRMPRLDFQSPFSEVDKEDNTSKRFLSMPMRTTARLALTDNFRHAGC